MEASDLTLMSGDLRGVPAAIALSRATMRVIRQNLILFSIVRAVCIASRRPEIDLAPDRPRWH
jgi:cation transport ATPase